jgi:Toxin SymE, type I toxin-antitoxin system
MRGRGTDSTSLPEPSGPFDDRFVYRLTAEGKKLLAEHERANGKPAFIENRCTPAVTAALDSETRSERKRLRRTEARARGVRVGTVGGRWRGGRRLPDLRLTGRWLEAAGFELGQEYELDVSTGRLTIHAI